MMPINKAITLADADVRPLLRRSVWRTVMELSQKLHMNRPIYRTQIAALLRKGVGCGTVETRRRSRAGKGLTGGGPWEYRRS